VDIKQSMAIAVSGAMLMGVLLLGEEKKHIEQAPFVPEAALLTDGAIISTHTGTAATLSFVVTTAGQFV
jgi:hypothetical protein